MTSPSDLLGEQPVPILSNEMIEQCLSESVIRIKPFHSDLLGPTFYGLQPHAVRYHRYDNEGLLEHGRTPLDEDLYRLRPQEYVIVSIEEQITIPQGMVGQFYPASRCIERGLLLTSGRLDAGYERAIVFGVRNASEEDVILSPDRQIARISFCWMGDGHIPHYEDAQPGDYIEDIDRIRYYYG